MNDFPYSSLMTLEELLFFNARVKLNAYRRKENIFLQGDKVKSVFFIKSGMVKVFKTGRNDRKIILNILKEGCFLGLMSNFGDKIYSFSAAAITDAEILLIEPGLFKNLMQTNGKYAYQVLNLISVDGLFHINKLMSLNHKQLPGRVAELILFFAEKIYNNNSFSFPLTRKELAELAGTTKESFIRTLTEFKNDKIVKVDGPKVEIISLEIIKTLNKLG